MHEPEQHGGLLGMHGPFRGTQPLQSTMTLVTFMFSTVPAPLTTRQDAFGGGGCVATVTLYG